MDLTYRFEYRHLDGRDPESYVQPLRRNIEDWQQHFVPAQLPLRYLTGSGFITIIDERPNLRRGRYTLGGIDAALYLAASAARRHQSWSGCLPEAIMRPVKPTSSDCSSNFGRRGWFARSTVTTFRLPSRCATTYLLYW